ncbi:hypothetical protein [Amycolatopsis sp. CA-230715]|uniref:hypothetical protein n=1 Tax=Amycolatopsis sp. CA-230715 TaxID=2745196 RepID=UPI001C023410|nr:hypothetical protein [Amycolatopsis sp. CA-230715]QWF82692.1 hypothetical protein HUW46_06131 [Amycolatopsis sp. CA-230715]
MHNDVVATYANENLPSVSPGFVSTGDDEISYFCTSQAYLTNFYDSFFNDIPATFAVNS